MFTVSRCRFVKAAMRFQLMGFTTGFLHTGRCSHQAFAIWFRAPQVLWTVPATKDIATWCVHSFQEQR